MESNRLRALREAKGVSGPELAADFGVDRTTVFRWETGITEMSDATKQRLAEYFGVSRAQLMGWDREEAAA